jgi:hypothetical protein
MKTAGNILSALFDERFVQKAQGYSKLFDSWADITAKNGMPSAAGHSRVKDIEKGILIIEMDHPGWKQILQTKQSKFLNDFRYRFPDLEISGISLILGAGNSVLNGEKEEAAEQTPPEQVSQAAAVPAPVIKGLDAIEDEEFKEKLRSLGQSIAEWERHPVD